MDDVLASRRVIVISRARAAIRTAWVTDDPCRDELKYATPHETIEKRPWSGQIVSIQSSDVAPTATRDAIRWPVRVTMIGIHSDYRWRYPDDLRDVHDDKNSIVCLT